ncbi:class II aldolase/adducin family protein [Mycobacterium lepromatosis]|uniref:class II aldolase/adducin family protein n=1 Tax=Mycobacterium lepromatosis TaxID=480418 RepID=UPI0006798884
MIEGTAGNTSARHCNGKVSTPSSVDYRNMVLDDLMLIYPEDGILQAKVGRERRRRKSSCIQRATKRSTTSAASIHSHPGVGRSRSPSRISRFRFALKNS